MGQKLFVILINTVKSLKGWFRKILQYIKASAAAQSLVRQYIMRAPGQRRSSSVRKHKYATQSGRTEEVSLGLLLHI